jgi:hypothetical protein
MATAIERRIARQRKARFLSALQASGLKSQSAWAREQNISKAHLSLVLDGHRPSVALWAKIEAFIAEHEQVTALAG